MPLLSISHVALPSGMLLEVGATLKTTIKAQVDNTMVSSMDKVTSKYKEDEDGLMQPMMLGCIGGVSRRKAKNTRSNCQGRETVGRRYARGTYSSLDSTTSSIRQTQGISMCPAVNTLPCDIALLFPND